MLTFGDMLEEYRQIQDELIKIDEEEEEIVRRDTVFDEHNKLALPNRSQAGSSY